MDRELAASVTKMTTVEPADTRHAGACAQPAMRGCTMRSAVYGLSGAVASTQPLASAAGADVLRAGGNAADAAVAVAAALAVTEPCSNGVGGDFFALTYDGKTAAVRAVLAAGSAPARLTFDLVRGHARDTPAGPALDPSSPLAITVPGAAAGWCALSERYGRVPLEQALAPATHLAERGFPVAPVTASQWRESEKLLSEASGGNVFLNHDGRAPRAGEVFRNPDLASTLREIAHRGHDGFYDGRISDMIVRTIRQLGGVMTREDMLNMTAEVDVTPISTTYRDVVVHEVPPPTHGVAVLLALNILETFDIAKRAPFGSDAHLHVVADAIRIAYADANAYVADPRFAQDRTALLLDKQYAQRRAKKLMSDERCVVGPMPGIEPGGTVQFCVVDGDGNAVSGIQSNYIGFGTGHGTSHVCFSPRLEYYVDQRDGHRVWRAYVFTELVVYKLANYRTEHAILMGFASANANTPSAVPDGCGFTLHSRGLNFRLDDPEHPNAFAGGKRPYHTIIPGMLTDAKSGSLRAAFGCMGSFMQPQGHVQLVSNLVDWGMNAQEALDAPRLRVQGRFAAAEGEIRDEIVVEHAARQAEAGLRRRGHVVLPTGSAFFGRGQIITRDHTNGVLCAGTDGRADGIALCLP